MGSGKRLLFRGLQSTQNFLQDSLRRNDTVRGFRDDEGLWAFDDLVGHYHVAAYRKAVHEECIVGQGHLFGVNRPVTVGAENLSVVFPAVCRPVLRIYEIRSFKGLALVLFDPCATGKCWIKLITMRMSDHEFIVGHVDALGE